MAKLPLSIVPRAEVDYGMEVRQIAGRKFVINDTAIPPLTPAAIMRLEELDSPLYKDITQATLHDAAAAVLVSIDPEIQDVHQEADTWLEANHRRVCDVLPELIKWLTEVPFYGFGMLATVSDGGTADRPWIFDGEFAGGNLAVCAKLTATPIHDVMHRMPLCLIGHVLAQYAGAMKGAHPIRPLDDAKYNEMNDAADAEERAGKLHWWQREQPFGYPLTDVQAKANPALIGEMKKLEEEYRRKHGI